MHAMMRTILIVAMAGLVPASAHAASREARRALEALEIFVSPGEGRTYLSRRGELLAVGRMGSQDEASRPRRGNPYYDGYDRAYEECVPGYGCRVVGGYGDPYYQPGYNGYGGGYAMPELVLTGRDLSLKPLAHDNLPLVADGPNPDVTMDHWRILFERTGKLETNPAPLVSTAALLAPIAGIDPVETASTGNPSRPVDISIVRRNTFEATADVQKLLNQLGHDAGQPDGLAGRNTEAAIRRFQAARGIEVTGRLTASLVDAIYLAAGKTQPAAGKVIVRKGGKVVLNNPVRIDTVQETIDGKIDKAVEQSLGTHLFELLAEDGKSGWQLVTLSKRNADYAGPVFGFAGDHEAAAQRALSRIHMPAEIRAKLAALAVPGSTLTLSDEELPKEPSGRY